MNRPKVKQQSIAFWTLEKHFWKYFFHHSAIVSQKRWCLSLPGYVSKQKQSPPLTIQKWENMFSWVELRKLMCFYVAGVVTHFWCYREVYFWLNIYRQIKMQCGLWNFWFLNYSQFNCSFICNCATNYDSVALMINAKPGLLNCHVVTVYEVKSLHSLCLFWWHLNVLWAQLTTTYLANKYTYSSIKMRLKAIIMDVSHGWLSVFVWCIIL